MFTVLLVIQILVTIALVCIILVQRSDADGLSGLGGGGGGNAFMTGRGAANLMTKTTAILATIFMVNSLALAIITSRMSTKAQTSIADTIESQPAEPTVPLADQPVKTAPAEPKAEPKAETPASEDAPAAEAPVTAPAEPVEPAEEAPKAAEQPAEPATVPAQ